MAAVPSWIRSASGVIASLALTFIGLTMITFVIGRVMPIDPVLAIVGDRAPKDVYDAMYAELGLDKPILVQYLNYLGNILRGDFGISIQTARPVLDDLLRFFPATLELATLATLVGIVLGVPMGVLAAVNQGRWIDHVVRVVGLLGYSVPVFWLGMVALLVFYAILQWVPGPGRLDVFYEGIVPPRTGLLLVDAWLAGDDTIFQNALDHLKLPVAILGTYALAYIARMTRSFMLDQLRQEYVLTAQGQGAERMVGGLAACFRQRSGAADHHHRPDLRLAARRLCAHRDRLLLARHRPVHHRRPVQVRHERGDRRHHRRRHVLCRRQHALRRALPDRRSQGSINDMDVGPPGCAPTSRKVPCMRAASVPSSPG